MITNMKMQFNSLNLLLIKIGIINELRKIQKEGHLGKAR